MEAVGWSVSLWILALVACQDVVYELRLHSLRVNDETCARFQCVFTGNLQIKGVRHKPIFVAFAFNTRSGQIFRFGDVMPNGMKNRLIISGAQIKGYEKKGRHLVIFTRVKMFPKHLGHRTVKDWQRLSGPQELNTYEEDAANHFLRFNLGKITLWALIKAYCNESYSGPNCNTPCDHPLGLASRNLRCNASTLRCAKGWTGLDCRLRDPCTALGDESVCHNDAECILTYTEGVAEGAVSTFRCLCKPGWTGPLCSLPKVDACVLPDGERTTYSPIGYRYQLSPLYKAIQSGDQAKWRYIVWRDTVGKNATSMEQNPCYLHATLDYAWTELPKFVLHLGTNENATTGKDFVTTNAEALQVRDEGVLTQDSPPLTVNAPISMEMPTTEDVRQESENETSSIPMKSMLLGTTIEALLNETRNNASRNENNSLRDVHQEIAVHMWRGSTDVARVRRSALGKGDKKAHRRSSAGKKIEKSRRKPKDSPSFMWRDSASSDFDVEPKVDISSLGSITSPKTQQAEPSTASNCSSSDDLAEKNNGDGSGKSWKLMTRMEHYEHTSRSGEVPVNPDLQDQSLDEDSIPRCPLVSNHSTSKACLEQTMKDCQWNSPPTSFNQLAHCWKYRYLFNCYNAPCLLMTGHNDSFVNTTGLYVKWNLAISEALPSLTNWKVKVATTKIVLPSKRKVTSIDLHCSANGGPLPETDYVKAFIHISLDEWKKLFSEPLFTGS